MRQHSLQAIGQRLAHIRASVPQREHAEALGVPLRTYQNYERGEREPDLRTVHALYDLGWSTNWLLTGEGPERLDALQGKGSSVAEQGAAYGSHELSVDHITIALELTDRCLDGGWLPRPLYAKLFQLMYQGITQGLPVATVAEVGQRITEKLKKGESLRDGESELGKAS